MTFTPHCVHCGVALLHGGKKTLTDDGYLCWDRVSCEDRASGGNTCDGCGGGISLPCECALAWDESVEDIGE